MKTIHKIVLLVLLVVPLCCSAQNFTTGGLLEKKDKGGTPVFYQKSSKKKCNGNVCGYVIPRCTKLGCSDVVASMLQGYYLDNNISQKIPFWDVAIRVEGLLSEGKEVGDWHLFVVDNPIFAMVSFDKKDTITITVSINDSIIFHGNINHRDRCRKKIIKYTRISCLIRDYSEKKFFKTDGTTLSESPYYLLSPKEFISFQLQSLNKRNARHPHI